MNINLDFIQHIQRIKKDYNLEIIDSHVHPFDVMGVVHHSENKSKINDLKTDDFLIPGMMEKMHFGRLANFLKDSPLNFYESISNNSE